MGAYQSANGPSKALRSPSSSRARPLRILLGAGAVESAEGVVVSARC